MNINEKSFIIQKRIVITLLIISIYLLFFTEHVFTLPATCGLRLPHTHLSCSIIKPLQKIGLALLPVTILYLLILKLFYLKSLNKSVRKK